MLIEDHGFREDVRAVRPKTRDIRKELFWKRDLTTRLVKENFMDTDKEDVSSLLRELYIRYINEEKEGLVLINTCEYCGDIARLCRSSIGNQRMLERELARLKHCVFLQRNRMR